MKRQLVRSNTCTNDLIKQRAGVEIPAAGTWTIVPGQPVTSRSRRLLRTEHVPCRTTGGALSVSADLATVTLEVGLRPDRVDSEMPLAIDLAAGLTTADRAGRWRFVGTATIDGATSPTELAIVYQGVHTRGAAPVVWLTMAEAFLTTGRGRRGRPSGFHVSGDLNARSDMGDADGGLPAIELAAPGARSGAAERQPVTPERWSGIYPKVMV